MTRFITMIGASAIALVGLGALAPSTATAQPACESGWTVRPGDTLYSIAGQCGSSVSAILEANSQIRDPSRIEVGWSLAIPDESRPTERDDQARAPAPRDGDSYAIRPGDTLAAIAERVGVSIASLLAANVDIDPRRLRIGQPIRIPGDRFPNDRWDWRAIQASVQPDAAAPGERVTVLGRNFRPGQNVRIAVGPPESEYRVIRRVRADRRGRVRARVEVPEWADPRRDLVWALVTDDRREAFARGFDVVAPEHGRGGPLEVAGTITREGVECPALRGRDGTLYTLAGDIGRFGPGDRVRVSGTTAELSFCQQGTTIRVEEISAIGRDDGRGGPIEVAGILTREGVECPALRGRDGTLYTLAGDIGRFRPGDRVRVSGTAHDFSTCQQGETIRVDRIEPMR